jgi:hypothetical protein
MYEQVRADNRTAEPAAVLAVNENKGAYLLLCID